MKIGMDQFNNLIEDNEADTVYHAFVSEFVVHKDRDGNPDKILIQLTVLGGPLSHVDFLREFDLA